MFTSSGVSNKPQSISHQEQTSAHISPGKSPSPKTVGVPLAHPPMRSLEGSAGSQLPPNATAQVPAKARRSGARPLAIPQPLGAPRLWRPLAENLVPGPRSPGERETTDGTAAPTHFSALFIHSTPPKCSSLRELRLRGPRERCGSRARGATRRQPGGRTGKAAGGASERDAELCRAAGRTGPGRQCAFVYVARAAAANMHLKSARVSARQRPAVQSPRRRAPRTPGPRSLWYISDLTSRLGLILRWERFCVHLGSPLGWVFFFFSIFFSERSVTSATQVVKPAVMLRFTGPQALSPHTWGGCNKSLNGKERWLGPGSWPLDPAGRGVPCCFPTSASTQSLAEVQTDSP